MVAITSGIVLIGRAKSTISENRKTQNNWSAKRKSVNSQNVSVWETFDKLKMLLVLNTFEDMSVPDLKGFKA